jgi:hypothetical protein
MSAVCKTQQAIRALLLFFLIFLVEPYGKTTVPEFGTVVVDQKICEMLL